MTPVSVAAGLVSLGLVASPALGQAVRLQSDTAKTLEVSARQALQTFARVVNKKNYQLLGFESPQEVRFATLSVPIPQYAIHLDELRSYQSGQDPAPLLHATGSLTYVVLVSGRTRSSLTLTRRGQAWEAVAYGSPAYARLVDSARTQLAARDNQAVADYFEVRIPALNVALLGVRRSGQIFLTPLRADPRFGFTALGTLPVGDALLAMVPAARQHNGLPT